MKLLVPLKIPIGRLLRILLYARYSTSEQKCRSIKDQFRVCREFLKKWGIENAVIQEISDMELSGELVNRPGIDEAREGIKRRAWDLIVAEDSSRLFRNVSACCNLVGGAYDQEIRVILPGDDVDTENDNWLEDLNDAQNHHCRSNAYTRKRVKRTIESLWEDGAAVGMLKPGYIRNPTKPAAHGKKAEGPHFDVINPQWPPTVREVFERIARRDAPWGVGEYATQTGFPKAKNAKSPKWSDRNILALIRNPIYRGLEEYRKKRSKRKFSSGGSKSVRNEPEKVLTRKMEHLRMVEDDLWYRANAVVDSRNPFPDAPRGIDHPLYNIPRDSRGPLSNLFFCGACRENKMHIGCRADGGYRCSNAKSGECWNKATALEDLTHQKIGQGIVAELLSGQGTLEAYIRHLKEVFQDDEPRRHRMEELRREIKSDAETCKRVIDMLVGPNADSPGLQERLAQLEQGLKAKSAELASLEAQGDQEQALPSNEELQAQLEASAAQLLSMEPEASRLLRRLLDGPILAIPYQQFGSNKVVLRAEIRIRIAGLLPDDLYLLLQSLKVPLPAYPQEVRTVLIDLFEPSGVPKNAKPAWDMLSAGKTRKQIQAALGITKRIACQAVRLGEQMAQAGLVDPYVRLTEPPANASRWGKRTRKSQIGDGPSQEPDAA